MEKRLKEEEIRKAHDTIRNLLPYVRDKTLVSLQVVLGEEREDVDNGGENDGISIKNMSQLWDKLDELKKLHRKCK